MFLDIASAGWVDRALCKDYPDLLIWTSESLADQAEAKDFCLDCPVMMDCLTWAIKNKETGGIWGGMSFGERKELQLRRSRWQRR